MYDGEKNYISVEWKPKPVLHFKVRSAVQNDKAILDLFIGSHYGCVDIPADLFAASRLDSENQRKDAHLTHP